MLKRPKSMISQTYLYFPDKENPAMKKQKPLILTLDNLSIPKKKKSQIEK